MEYTDRDFCRQSQGKSPLGDQGYFHRNHLDNRRSLSGFRERFGDRVSHGHQNFHCACDPASSLDRDDMGRVWHPVGRERSWYNHSDSLNSMLINLGYNTNQIETIINMRMDHSATVPDKPALSNICFDYVKVQNHMRNWRTLPKSVNKSINGLVRSIHLPRTTTKISHDLSKVASEFADRIREVVQSHLSETSEDLLSDLRNYDLTTLSDTQSFVSDKFRNRFQSDFLEECWSEMNESTQCCTDISLASYNNTFEPNNGISSHNVSFTQVSDGTLNKRFENTQSSYCHESDLMHKNLSSATFCESPILLKSGLENHVSTVFSHTTPIPNVFCTISDRSTPVIPPAPPIEDLRIIPVTPRAPHMAGLWMLEDLKRNVSFQLIDDSALPSYYVCISYKGDKYAVNPEDTDQYYLVKTDPNPIS